MADETVTKSTIANGRQSLIVESRVRETLERKGFQGIRLDGDLIGALSAHTEEVLVNAARRAKANGRATIKPEDL